MIEPAYKELARLVATALQASGFIPQATDLKVDPESAFTPTGNERSLIQAAALMKVQTASVRQTLGRTTPRHIVERSCQVDLAIAGPAAARRKTRVEDALLALALIPVLHPTLNGTAERLTLGDQADDELPPT